jgi:cysteine synthase A
VLSAGAGALSVTWAAARLGHQTIAVLPSTAPPHIVRLIRWMGGTCHQIDPAEIGETVGRLQDDPSVYYLSQADEPEIVDHYRPIADEILTELGEVDAITVGIGTGASISGIGRGVRDSPGADCRIVGVEPEEAPVASGGTWAPHTIHGLAPPMPQTQLDRSVLTEIMQVPSATAWRYARDVLRDSALPIGPSAGATVAAAVELQARGAHGPIVAVCACSIYAYLDVAPDLDAERERS